MTRKVDVFVVECCILSIYPFPLAVVVWDRNLVGVMDLEYLFKILKDLERPLQKRGGV